MMNLARAISFLLSPVFILFPTIFILIAKFSQDYSHALKWTMFSYIFVLIIVLFVVAGVMLGFFSNFDVSKREQRPPLFAFCAFVVVCYSVALFALHGPKVLFVALFAITLGLIIISVVNKWIKASIHLATFTSAAILIEIAYKGYAFFLLALIPLLAWARVKTKEHSPRETIAGVILGAATILMVYLISKQFLLGIIYPAAF